MRIRIHSLIGAALLALVPLAALAQQPARPQIQTTKVEGTDGVYVFRNGAHQAMFVVTTDGVIVTDPVAYGRPTGGQDYLNEIRKVTNQPIRMMIYSHHHFDHIAGGKAFKDAGATFVAHRRARERLQMLGDPHTVMPDVTVDDKGVSYTVGNTTLELSLDWDRLIPGHPGPGDRLGTKKDVEDQLQLLQTASATMQKLAREGKCWDAAEKEFALPQYEKWPGYANNLQFVARRYCGLWGRGT